jgi:hypothetical protein
MLPAEEDADADGDVDVDDLRVGNEADVRALDNDDDVAGGSSSARINNKLTVALI